MFLERGVFKAAVFTFVRGFVMAPERRCISGAILIVIKRFK
jgi:hypothetical protein